MNNLISKRFNLLFPHQCFLSPFPQVPNKTPHHIFPRKLHFNTKTLTLCSVTSPNTLSYNGWDDPRFIANPQTNNLSSFLSSLGIDHNKYVFVYLLGFVCALAISRVKVSSIIAIPGCVIVFALGFSIGAVKGGRMSLDGSKRLYQDKIFRDFVEKLKGLVNGLNKCDVGVESLRKGVRKGIEFNQISADDLQSFDKILESMNFASLSNVVQGCIESLSIEAQEMERNVNQKTAKRKESGKYGFDFSQIASGLFQTKSVSKSTKMRDYDEGELMDTNMKGSKQKNILTPAAAKERNSDILFDMNVDGASGGSRHSSDDGAIRQDKVGETFGTASRMNVASNENDDFSGMDRNTVDSVFNREEYTYQTSRIHFMRNQRVSRRMNHPGEFNSWASVDSLDDSMDFNVNMEHTRSEASYLREEMAENLGERSHFGGKESDEGTYRYLLREEMRNHEKEPPVSSNETSNESKFGSFPSSESSVDLQFNQYLTEANILVKEAKDCLRKQGSDGLVENALYKSAILLSKAIDVRPMSLLAVGLLGNTYLLHGELKLRVSRDLRALLTDTSAGNKRTKIHYALDDMVPGKDKLISDLVNVCEECEELLVKAGRQYRLALSIDGNDVRALYNWGLALSFRAQLIADIGPGAARDADKVFMAAIDKFDAMMSRGNTYAPDALFRWATALQQRSRLRPRTSREKVKLLQQAQRLYEDALHMDSNNLQVQDALFSCISELNYWYR